MGCLINSEDIPMSVYKRMHPYQWIKDRLHLGPEKIEVVLGFFILWIALILFSYFVSILIYLALTAMGMIEKGFFHY